MKAMKSRLEKLQPYTIAFDVEKHGSRNAVKIDANEGWPIDSNSVPNLAEKILASDLSRYPDPKCQLLIDILHKRLDISKDSILLGNGTDEIIRNLFISFAGRKLLLPNITYPVYDNFAELFDISVSRFELNTEDFSLNKNIHEFFLKEKPDLAVFGFPNNPTGNCFDRDVIEKLIIDNPETVFLIDEAYHEFGNQTFMPWTQFAPNVIVTRTLSKAWGLAGIRIGYASASAPIVSFLKKLDLPYPINTLSQIVAIQHLKSRNTGMAHVINSLTVERERVSSKLRLMSFYKVYPSDANFIFISLPDETIIDELKFWMESQHTYLRYFNYPGIGKFIRFSIGKPEDNDKAINALNDFYLNLPL